jgi:DedD protein
VDLPQVDLIGRSGTENPPAMASADTTAMTQTGNWVVQAGSFSQQENANDLRDKLIGQGFDAFVESSDTAGQTLYRVRIGPQSSRGQGESTLARLRALGFDGQVVSLRN